MHGYLTDIFLVAIGTFSKDGTQIVVSDVQGYFSVFGSGPPPICLKEQFFAKDYDPLTYDHAGWCEDATTQQPPHLLPRQLADSEMTPYPDVLQPAFGGSGSLPRFWYATHSLSQAGNKKECARWHRFEELPLPDPGPARAPDRTDATKLSKLEMLSSGGYELGTADRDASDALSDTTPRRHSRSLGAAPAAATSAASAGRSNVRTIVDLSQSDASAPRATPVYREDDGGLSDSGTDSEGEAFDHEEEGEDEEDDDEEEEDTDEEEEDEEEEDDEEDYDFGSTRRTRATRASSRRARSGRGARSTQPAARASGTRVSSRRRAAGRGHSAAKSEDSDYSDEEVQPTRRSTRPRKRARVALESDEESEDENTVGGARGSDDDYDDEAEDGQGEQFDEEGWYETQEDDTIQSISAWHGLDEDELLDMNRRRIRGLSQCKPAIAKKMKLKKGTWLQLSEVVGPGWGDAEDEDVPVVDHASRRRQRAAKAQGGRRAAAAASPRGNNKKQKVGKQVKPTKPNKSTKQNGRRGTNSTSAAAKRAEKNPNEMIPRNAYYWLNEHHTFLFRYVPQVDDEVTYVHALHREYDAGSRVRLMTPPYESIRGLRSAEHCKVTSLEYFLATPPTIIRNYSVQHI